MDKHPSFPSRGAGFTLVEVMIAMLIGIIGIVVMMQTFSVSEGFKRTATSGTDAQINGAVALYMMEREIRLAGYGMNTMIPSGCSTIRVWNNTTGKGMNLRMVPFEINPPGIPAGDANTDVILISYGSSDNFVTGVPADQPSNSASNFKVTRNRDGFRAGDLVIGMQPGGGPGGTTSCVLHELTGVPGGGGNCGAPASGGSDVLNHNTGKYKNPNANCEMVDSTYNKAGGIDDENGNPVPPLKSSAGGTLFNLGALPQVKIYAIRGGHLTTCNAFSTDCTDVANYVVAVNDIVSLRAIYGKDFDGSPTPPTAQGDGVVDVWSRAALANSNQISRVLGASVGIAARSGLKERPVVGNVCDATVDPARPDRAQEWFGPTATPNDGTLGGAQVNLATTSPDWQCYRYKLFQTSVPLRNMIWRP
jgi:type IV pilus assembly protein PilW